VPSGPGFVGTFEFFALSALTLFGVDPSPALSFAVLYHASTFLPTVALGVLSLWLDNLPIRRQGWVSQLLPAHPGEPETPVEQSPRI
jgi:uncharacterized membrane protein YbhN (UPF0104 family)